MTRLPYSPALTFALLTLLLCDSRDAAAAENYLPTIGGNGGAQFIAPCPGGQNLAGFELRAGDDIDAIHPVCVSAYDTGGVDPPQLTEGSGLVQHYSSANRAVLGEPYSEFLGDWSTLPEGWHGGIGGGRASVICPDTRPIVVGIDVAAEGVNTVTVNNIHLFCAEAVAPRPLEANPSAIFDAPQATGIVSSASQRCPEGQVAIGVHGRSGEWLDAIGLICDVPRMGHALALGRVKRAEGVPNPNEGKSFCELAAAARAANRPTAAALQQRCDAQLAASAAAAPTAVKEDHSYLADVFSPAPAANAPAPAPAPAAQPAEKKAVRPPVEAPHDLFAGGVGFLQYDNKVGREVQIICRRTVSGEETCTRAVLGEPVRIYCNYTVNVVPSAFASRILEWRGYLSREGLGMVSGQSKAFSGETMRGSYNYIDSWTPKFFGKYTFRCRLNGDFAYAEANPGNNEVTAVLEVIEPAP